MAAARGAFVSLLLFGALCCSYADEADDVAASLAADECNSQGTASEEVPSSCSLALLQRRGSQLHLGAEESRKTKRVMKGVSYGPSPLANAGHFSHNDFFCDNAKPMWGDAGRGDLNIIKKLGANTVRLYGNDPEAHHDDFLDHAHFLGLGVIPGMGDAAFDVDACKGSGKYECTDGVKDAYLKNLQRGFLQNGSYHPSIEYFIVVNEPELKLPALSQPRDFAKAIATGIDGVLEAEKEAAVTGPKPNLTVTFSFANCAACTKFGNLPGLGQMWMMRDALQHPEKYGLSPKNDLNEFFNTRFTFSFNSGNPSEEIKSLFLDLYEKEFPTTPIFVAEYHNPGNKHTQKDLENILSIAEESPLLLGISFFEFQNRYDIAGHLIWGMFDPQVFKSGLFLHFAGERIVEIPCLTPVYDKNVGKTIPQQITSAYGGPGIDLQHLCEARPDQVLVSEHGFGQVQGLKNTTAMKIFIKRVVEHMGGHVPYAVPDAFAEVVNNAGTHYSQLEALLAEHPEWARWDLEASCVVDQEALKSEVGNKIGYVCGLGHVDCSKLPPSCKESVWDTANWVFGTHFREKAYLKDGPLTPLEDCFFDGAASFTRSSAWTLAHKNKECVVPLGKPDANKVFVSEYGYSLVWLTKDLTKMDTFIRRTVAHMGGLASEAIPQAFLEDARAQNASFEGLVDKLTSKPDWAEWAEQAACVPDPNARPSDVGAQIGAVCGKGIFNCAEIPAECKGSVWDTASFVFSSHYAQLLKVGLEASPLRDCNFNRVARFTSSALYHGYKYSSACIVPTSAKAGSK
eukprot:gb/GFBE01008982.1/.p1 GENE.gb/GFBE01008982.1/~~gb/GFBE01008982.1/.p1  ORF type:complete len:797 (+),score=181.71 gb/GFBE01008982.1/:1-2391(+)